MARNKEFQDMMIDLLEVKIKKQLRGIRSINIDAIKHQKVIDVNEDSISNLLDPSKSISKKYIGERFAMGHYRILSPLMPICLALIACAVMLHGRVLRDKVGIKIFVSSICGICFQRLFILSRSITASNPSLWFVMYLSIIIPCITFVLILFYPNIANYIIEIIYDIFDKKYKEKLS